MNLERNAVFACVKNSVFTTLPPEKINFKDGDADDCFDKIEAKRKELADKNGTKVALCVMTDEEGEILFANDDVDVDLG